MADVTVMKGDPSRGYPLGRADWWSGFYESAPVGDIGRTTFVDRLRDVVQPANRVSNGRRLDSTRWEAQIIMLQDDKEGYRRFPGSLTVYPIRSVTAVPVRTATGGIARPRALSFDGGTTPINELEKRALLEVSETAREFYAGDTGAVQINTGIADLRATPIRLMLREVRYRGNVPEQIRTVLASPAEAGGSPPANQGGQLIGDFTEFIPSDADMIPTSSVPTILRKLQPPEDFKAAYGSGDGTTPNAAALGGSGSPDEAITEDSEAEFATGGINVGMIAALAVAFLLIFGGR